MLLEDYFDALAFAAGGVPNPRKWVDDLREKAGAASFGMLM